MSFDTKSLWKSQKCCSVPLISIESTRCLCFVTAFQPRAANDSFKIIQIMLTFGMVCRKCSIGHISSSKQRPNSKRLACHQFFRLRNHIYTWQECSVPYSGMHTFYREYQPLVCVCVFVVWRTRIHVPTNFQNNEWTHSKISKAVLQIEISKSGKLR